MALGNTPHQFGWISIALHWGVAVTVFGLFAVGLYMVDLTYYDSLYTKLPHWHRSVGLLLLAVVLFRLLWRWWSPPPAPLATHRRWERRVAATAHLALYLLLIAMCVSGYLMSSASGRAIPVFDWFSVPSVTGRVANMEDIAGNIHEWLAWTLMGLVSLHAAGALKHHFIDRDNTLKRMLGWRHPH